MITCNSGTPQCIRCQVEFVITLKTNVTDMTLRTILVSLSGARQSDVFNIFHKKPKGLLGDVAI